MFTVLSWSHPLYLNHLVEVTGQSSDHVYPHSIDDCILMRYTNFKDKNGEKIYFKDVVLNTYTDIKMIVSDITVAYWIIDEDKMNRPMEYVEKLGNICEKPELLKDE